MVDVDGHEYTGEHVLGDGSRENGWKPVKDGLDGDGGFVLRRRERMEIWMLWFWYICIQATYILGLTSWSYRCAG
jgi:hypothetical protein